MVAANEIIAHQRMQDAFHRFAVTIRKYSGMAHEIRGDALVAEFTRASDAVNASLEFQTENYHYNQSLEDDIRPELRVGISMGEVVVSDGTITGTGIVLAQRLEQLARPNQTVVQGSVAEIIPPRFDIRFDSLGEQLLKGFESPVRALVAAQAEATGVSSAGHNDGLIRTEGAGPASLSVPDAPSIAVLPFENMSGDPEQEFFADGITEDIITALSKFREFFVIARNSTFSFKGSSPDIRQVGQELGVRYVLEGSVRRAGDRVRITAQLIEADSGSHIWAERYDRNLQDLFDLQDEITSTIAGTIGPERAVLERRKALRRPTGNLGAWELSLRGAALLWKNDRDSILEGCATIREALQLDPEFGEAYGYLAFGQFQLLIYGWAEDFDATVGYGLEVADRAISIDHRDYFAHHALGRLKTMQGDHSGAVRALETCVELNPNFAFGYTGLAEAHVYSGSPEEAIRYADIAIRLSPREPMLWDFLHYKASAYLRQDAHELAIETFEQACEYPSAQYPPFATLAALYAMDGRGEDAKRALSRACKLEPGLSITKMKEIYGVVEERPGSRSARLLDALRDTGLEEN